jgi:SAM-dependent methyltransferase
LIDHDNLEDFADAVDYDIRDSSDTGVAFYSALARETGGPVLEICCGTGRVSIPIARLGFAVTGVDIVPGMIAQAAGKSAGLPVRWVQGDARTFDLAGRYRLVFLTGNAFQAFLTRADQELLLDRVRAHLDADGLFAFETRNPRWASSEPAGTAVRTRPPGLFTFLETRDREEPGGTYVDAAGNIVSVSRMQSYDHVAQVLHWTTRWRWRERGRERTRVTRIAVRFTFPQELEALLHHNGFEIIRLYGDWNLEPLAAESPSIIVVCRRRDRPATAR